ncbi:MAG TPA: hypothetical protein VI485_14050 [Vicinamibacterales bacterium]|nr:hypothetical protein [Vicinamibacterales bacterium]
MRIDFIGEIDDLEGDIYADEDVAAALSQDALSPGLWYRTGVGWYS